jgi:hypothetical protein
MESQQVSTIYQRYFRNIYVELQKHLANISVTIQEHFVAYCTRREAVKLFRFLLSPHGLTTVSNNVQNCTFRLYFHKSIYTTTFIIKQTHGVNIRFLLCVSCYSATCFDPFLGSSSGYRNTSFSYCINMNSYRLHSW